MSDHIGNDRARAGSYLGSAPQNGFGRKAGAFGARPADPAALSALAQKVVDEHRAEQRADPNRPTEIDFVIGGHDIQYVEIELDPGEAVVAENGAMIWKDQDVEFSLVLGDGRDDKAGLASKLFNAGTNMVSGESFYLSQFRHGGFGGKARIALGGKLPGSIVAVQLAKDDELICHRTSFLAGAKGVAVNASVQRDLMGGLFGQEGLITQTLTGEGWVFLHIGGALIERDLAPGERIQVDSGCVVAHDATARLSVAFAGGIGTTVAGGEGLLLATLAGPGRVWIQTLPFKRVADAIVQAGHPTATASVAGGIGAGIGYGIEHAVKEGGIDLLKKIF